MHSQAMLPSGCQLPLGMLGCAVSPKARLQSIPLLLKCHPCVSRGIQACLGMLRAAVQVLLGIIVPLVHSWLQQRG